VITRVGDAEPTPLSTRAEHGVTEIAVDIRSGPGDAVPVKKLYVAAHVYMILGLVSGLAYREVTKIEHYTGDSQLSVVHTHLLALGMLFFLVVLALEKVFSLSANRRLFTGFFWVYNAGLAVTVAAMVVRGTLTVYGHDGGDVIAGIAGLGHITLTVGLILLFVGLGKRVSASTDAAKADHPAVGSAPTAQV
jgi:hypothetical protein